MAWTYPYPSLRFHPTVEGCAYDEAFAAVVPLLLAKKPCCGLVEFVAVAANFPHQLSGLLKRDVVLPCEVVNVIGGVRCTPRDAPAQLLPLRHADGFHDNDIATHRYSLGRWLREFYWP
jgi:hypothetical protein